MTAIKTNIRIWQGIDSYTDVPTEVHENGLVERTAVVQDTYREDMVDMFFDQQLFLRLLDFLAQASGEDHLSVFKESTRSAPQSLLSWFRSSRERHDDVLPYREYLQEWKATPEEDREPPLRVLAFQNDELSLCLVTEYWARVGGPEQYHDSYTYSLFSRSDLCDQVFAFLKASPTSKLWDLQRRG